MSHQNEDYSFSISWHKDHDKGGSVVKTKKAKEIISTGTAIAAVDGNIRSTHDNKNSVIGDSGNSTVFTRHDNVVIVTKIHGAHQWPLLVQSMCLLHYAYNNKVLYDIVVFSTDPVPNEDIVSIQEMLHPVKFSLVVDNRGLQEEIASLPPAKYETFLKMCNVTNPTNLTWFSYCAGNRLAYNWQAEFRSVHLWHHPAMADYKTMVWLDTDGFATKEWEKDPVDYFIKNDGVIMFDHFPMGHSRYWVQERFYAAWNKTLCGLEVSKETGNFVSEIGTGRKARRCFKRGIPNIHGFFHITNMDFYRSELVTHGLHTILANCFLCRFPDDQLAVTAPAAILAPERSWEMRPKGFHLDVFHNHKLDGIDQATPAGFKQFWDRVVKRTFTSAALVCKITEAG